MSATTSTYGSRYYSTSRKCSRRAELGDRSTLIQLLFLLCTSTPPSSGNRIQTYACNALTSRRKKKKRKRRDFVRRRLHCRRSFTRSTNLPTSYPRTTPKLRCDSCCKVVYVSTASSTRAITSRISPTTLPPTRSSFTRTSSLTLRHASARYT